jgi:hypothetical protein
VQASLFPLVDLQTDEDMSKKHLWGVGKKNPLEESINILNNT